MGKSARTARLEGSEPAGAGVVAARDGETPGGDAAPLEPPRGSGTTVENGEVKQLSVSSIAKYDPGQYGGCPRRWWYHYVGGKPEPQSKAAAKGTDAHRCIEQHLRNGEPLVGVARAAAPLCKQIVQERFAVEQPIAGGLVAAGVPLVGSIDLVRWERGEILDWKTTSKKPEALPTGESLLQTVQMPGYGQWYLNATGDCGVHLSHAYIQAGWRAPVVRSAEWTREQVQTRWGEVEGVVQLLKRDARATSAEDVPANTNACDAYRGCPHLAYCAAGRRGISMGTLVEELKKRKQKKTDVLPPDAPTSGEAAPAAEPMTAEELATQSPEVQKAVQEFDLSEANTEIKLTYTNASVVRVFNLGLNEGRADVGLTVQLNPMQAQDPRAVLKAMLAELDAVGAEYRAKQKKAA